MLFYIVFVLILSERSLLFLFPPPPIMHTYTNIVTR